MRTIRLNLVMTVLTALLAVILFGCGGSETTSFDNQASIDTQSETSDAQSAASVATQLAVLVPDDYLPDDPRVKIWADTAWEEGVQLTFITDSQFEALGTTAVSQYPGIILPDMIHQKADDALIASITAYSAAGGKVMLVYDFGALTTNGFYVAPSSRLGTLAGIDYMFFDALQDQTIGLGPVTGTSTVLRTLQVPPGKSMAATTTTTATSSVVASAQNAKGHFLSHSLSDPGGLKNYKHAKQFDVKIKSTRGKKSKPTWYAQSQDAEESISGYFYGVLSYPAFVTASSATYKGTILLKNDFGYASGNITETGVSAGYYGNVLFVNIPLGYLNGQTDGMLMHGFLRYFSSMTKSARLNDHPDGIGGLVFNWHCDSAGALDPIKTLDNNRIWSYGPFSIHFTAGPDTIVIGDGLGFNVPADKTTQAWIKYLLGKRHQIGSHGGWDHDLYGTTATEYNASEYVPGSSYTYLDFLTMNVRAMEAVTGKTETEYSAPQGNNPLWAMNWLAANNHVGYYFAGHTGVGPTRAYRPPLVNEGIGYLQYPTMWAFPFTPLGKNATFEDFDENGVTDAQITTWHNALMDFAVENRTSRLIYAHPPGAEGHLAVMKSLMTRAKKQTDAGKFKWYTMTELAQFEARRLQVVWSETISGTKRIFNASHPTSLKSFTWLLPRSGYAKPIVTTGRATVERDADNWIVTAERGTTLSFMSGRF